MQWEDVGNVYEYDSKIECYLCQECPSKQDIFVIYI